MAGGHKQPIEERVQGSEGFFRSLAENSLDLILVADVDGIARYANSSVERVLGYAPEEFVGMNVPDLLHPEDHEQVMKVFAEAAENPPGTASRFAQGRYRCKDGSWSWIEGIAINLLDDPETKGILCCGRDITERKRAELLLRSLTPREAEVLRLLALGRTNREIAREMLFSVSTVKNHVQHIIAKLGVSDRTQAAVRAVELGLIEQDR